MTPRLRKCDERTIAGRLAKAEQFMEGAKIIRELAADEPVEADFAACRSFRLREDQPARTRTGCCPRLMRTYVL